MWLLRTHTTTTLEGRSRATRTPLALVLLLLAGLTSANAAPFAWVRALASGTSTEHVYRIDLATHAVTELPPSTNGVENALAVHPNQDLVYTEISIDDLPEDFHWIRVINGATGEDVTSIEMTGYVRALAVNRAGTRLYAGKRQGKIAVIDTTNNSVITHDVLVPMSLGFAIGGLAVLPNNSKVYASVSDLDVVGVVNAATNTVTKRVTVGGGPLGVAATPDSSKVFVAVQDHLVKVISTATDSVTGTINFATDQTPRWVTVNPAGTRAFVQVDKLGADDLVEINVATNAVVRTTAIPEPAFPGLSQGIAMNADGTRVYWVGGDGVVVIDAATHGVITTVPLTFPSARGDQFIKPPCAGCCS